jgi:hypothetical protein
MELKPHLMPKLKALRLSGILDTLEVRARQAGDEHWTYHEFLERLLEDEVERRQQKQLALRLRRAALSSDKTLETFDFTFNPGVPKARVYDLATAQFVRDKRNVLLCGPTGVGKPQPTHYPARPDVSTARNRDGHRSPSFALRFHTTTGRHCEQAQLGALLYRLDRTRDRAHGTARCHRPCA